MGIPDHQLTVMARPPVPSPAERKSNVEYIEHVSGDLARIVLADGRRLIVAFSLGWEL